jgi:hypothetical protein
MRSLSVYLIPLLLFFATMQTSCALLVRRSTGRWHIQQQQQQRRLLASVTGTEYRSLVEEAPVVRLFTKEGCTLCDKVKGVLVESKDEYPHSLEQVDITDAEHADTWFSKYKYDIPVLHIGNHYWIKHRLEVEEAKAGLTEAMEGRFTTRQGEPDAGEMERRQAERDAKT